MNRKRVVSLPVLCLLGLCLLLEPSCGAQREGRLQEEWLDEVEDLSESLANDLLSLSVAVRDRDLGAAAAFFTDPVEATPLPTIPGELEPVVKWIHRHGWSSAGGEEQPVSRDAFLGQLEGLLGHFREIEDARFKVKGAEFDPDRPGEANARIRAFVIGRDDQGRREGLNAWMAIEAVKQAEASWKITRVHVESLESKISQQDLFSEVALPAGVSALFPAFGEGANTGFVSHGAAADDVNGDGLLDLAATGVDRNYLYLNLGDGRFRDASADCLVAYAPPGSGALFLDYDNDGDPDLFLAAVGTQMLLENRWIPDGELKFWDVSEQAGVSVPAVGFSAAAADVNGDGHTDVYVASYNKYGTVMPNAWHQATNGTPNLLFLNRGDGTFREAAEEWGVRDSRWSYAAGFADVDHDGDQDLYVANDFGENAYYRNDGERFSDMARQAGIVDTGFGMGVSFADYDNDGDLDLHVTNMSSTAGNRILRRLYPEGRTELAHLSKLAAGNSLYENQGDGTFVDVTHEAGGFTAGWAFGGGFIDFDNDGWEDLYTPNGFVSGKTMNDT